MARKDWDPPELFGLGFDSVQVVGRSDPRPDHRWRRGALEVTIEPTVCSRVGGDIEDWCVSVVLHTKASLCDTETVVIVRAWRRTVAACVRIAEAELRRFCASITGARR